ncbi:MAG: restriction endonuclease subunit S [Candidatus Cloacimonas acidaminovorans]|nr:restriction endonuclease subunit S [Candidatus Cloacimonas acidaminovorans]
MAEINNKPALRFAGFTEAWEQRKLSELATMHARIGWQNLRTSEFLDSGDYMLITGTDFEDGAINYSTCHYVEKMRYDQDTHIQIDNGSILITKDGTLGKVAYVQGLSMPATLNAGVFNVEIKDEKEVDRKYLFQYLKAPFLMDYVDKKATGGTIKHLNQNILVDFPVVLPNIEEQTSIGAYFSSLDNLITLHQRKYDNLKNVKKACLEKMFPKNGSNVPEIRFKGFTEAWEQRKLGEVVGITSGFMGDSLLSDGKYHLTRIETIADGIVDENRIGYSNKKPDDMYLLNHGDILYSNINSISHMGKVAKYQGNSTLYHGINLLRLQPENNINSDFLLYLLNTEKCRNWAKTRANQAVSQASINQSLLATQEIAISSFDEQEKIGKYFVNLDNLITLHQRKLEKLKNLKKACLEKMFI